MKITTHISLFLVCLTLALSGKSQVIFSEDFESVTHPNLPTQWNTTSFAPDGGFYTGNSDSAKLGLFWVVKDHTTFAMSNDDVCGTCDKSDDYLILPTIDLSGFQDSTVFLQFDSWMENFWGGIGTIKVDTGAGWVDVYTMVPVAEWQTRVVDLSPFAGLTNVSVAFHYNDEGMGGLGLAIDDISVYVPSNNNDVSIYEVSNSLSDYKQIPLKQMVPVTLNATIFNNGKKTLTNVQILAESVNNSYAETINVGSLTPAEYINVDFSNGLIIANSGLQNITYSVVHDNTDAILIDNVTTDIIQVSDSIMAKESGTINDSQIPLDGETIAQTFTVYNKDTLTSISVHFLLASFTDSVKFYVYEMVGGFPENIIDSSQGFSSLTSGWNTYNFNSGIELDSGYYAIGIKKMGSGLTAITATKDQYLPFTTFTTHFFVIDYYWYYDEQGFGVLGAHHTYLLRANFGKNINYLGNQNTNNMTEKITVYPNPTVGNLNIDLGESGHFDGDVSIYNILGERVYFQEGVHLMSSHAIDLSNFRRGLYIMTLDHGNSEKDEVFKIHKQ